MTKTPLLPVARILAGIFCALLLLSWAHPLRALAGKGTLTIGLLPEINVFKQKKRFEPLAAYLGEKVGLKIELTMLSRYGNIVERLQEHKVDGAFLGSFTGALAISQLEVEPLARPVNLDGTSTYFGRIFVRKDSGIESVRDMEGKVLVLVERATTAGYIFPVAYFKRNGVSDLGSYFKEHYFCGSHDAAIMAVFTGRADVGAAKSTIWDLVVQASPQIAEELAVLADSHRVPSNSLCVRPELDGALKERLKRALLDMHLDPAAGPVLESLGAFRFEETTRDDYQPVFELARDAGIRLEEYQYINE